jgi:hypothetical protein
LRRENLFWNKKNDVYQFYDLPELSQNISFLANESLNPSRLLKPETKTTATKIRVLLSALTNTIPIALIRCIFLKSIVMESSRILVKQNSKDLRDDKKIKGTSKILCITHFIGKSQGVYKDMYFGDFFSNYRKDEISYFFINQTSLGVKDVTNYLKSNFHFDFKVGEKTPSFRTLAKLLIDQYQGAIKLLILLNSKLPHIKGSQLLLTLNSQFCRAAINNLLITSSILNYIRHNNLDRIVITFEGNAYESCLYHEISRRFPEIEFILLQHAPVTPKHIGIRNQLGRVLDNATIGTSGYYTARIFQGEITDTNFNKIEVFGSTKFRSPQTQIPRKLAKICLIAPEGIQSAVEEMLDLSLILASEMQDVHFVFRVHPVLGDHLEKLKTLHKSKFDNFEISTKSIEEDFIRSGVCIYRGSSVAIEGAAFGVIPIYFCKEGETGRDPIYLDNHGNFQTNEPRQVIEKIRDLESLSEHSFRIIVDELRAYSVDYFAPLKPIHR